MKRKRCRQCRRLLPVSEFPPNPRTGKLLRRCRSCPPAPWLLEKVGVSKKRARGRAAAAMRKVLGRT